MKVVSWNVRGMGADVKWSQLRGLIKRHSVDMVFVQESKLASFSQLDAKRLWGDDEVNFRITSAEGRSGGLLVLWDKKRFTVSSSICERRFIALKGRWVLEDLEASMVNVYAPNTEGDQLSCWNDLISLRQEWKSRLTWLREGDSNTAFFYRATKIKAKRRGMSRLKCVGGWKSDPLG
ncbi:hypothetical protein V6N13_033312 [Hibiscus sabdariffa]